MFPDQGRGHVFRYGKQRPEESTEDREDVGMEDKARTDTYGGKKTGE